MRAGAKNVGIAASQELLAMTEYRVGRWAPSTSLRAQRSNPCRRKESMDCFVARAPRNDGVSCWPMGPIHVFASTAKQSMPPHKESMDCFVARAPRNDGVSCWQMDPIHVFASTAKQSIPPHKESM